MERILLTRTFVRWMRKTRLTEQALLSAVEEMAAGLIDANLGGAVFKKRVALPGRGKRDSTRVIVASKMQGLWVFLYGFEKRAIDSIDSKELKALQELASDYLALNAEELDRAILQGIFTEI